MLKANYHTHTKLCRHAEGMPEDYIKKAIELGFLELGMSDHGPVPEEFMSHEEYINNWIQRNMSLEEYYTIYLPSLDDAIKKYGNKIKIYKGLEVEYIKGHEEYYLGLKANLDYLNLGIHYFASEGIQKNSYSDVNYKTIYDYASCAIEGMKTGIYKCLVHPDLFYFAYQNEEGKHVFDRHCVEVSRRILEVAEKEGIYVEVNANGLENSKKYGFSEWAYPRREFWELAKDYPNLKIIIGSDAHKMSSLYNDNVKQVEKFCQDLGLAVKPTMEF